MKSPKLLPEDLPILEQLGSMLQRSVENFGQSTDASRVRCAKFLGGKLREVLDKKLKGSER